MPWNASRSGSEPSRAELEVAEADLRASPRRARRLGRNPRSGAVAVFAVHKSRALVAIAQDAACMTVLTWLRFVPRLPESGRSKMPRKWGRILRRLTDLVDDFEL